MNRTLPCLRVLLPAGATHQTFDFSYFPVFFLEIGVFISGLKKRPCFSGLEEMHRIRAVIR